jgi:uncharacterized protein DUF6077
MTAAEGARAADRTLDFLVLAFAAWTAIYHVCLVLRLGVLWAGIAMAAALLPCAWAARRSEPAQHDEGLPRDAPGPAPRLLAPAVVMLGLVAAALFAFTGTPWRVVWVLLAGAAAGAALLVRRRPPAAETPGGVRRADALVVLAWAVGLAVLSLFLVRADGDDTHYLHLASWIAAHGELPLRDVLFSDQALPAIFYPPVSSYEALAGTLARASGVAVPNVVYYGVPPLGSALAVLAMWRLLRAWGVRMVGVALTVAIVFLLWDTVPSATGDHKALGSLFVGRMWQGKILFLCVLVPVLFVLLGQYAARPSHRALVLLAAAGAAGVGLTITGVVLVPVIAAGCLAPLALRAPRRAALGFAATAAYPAASALVSVVVGARNAQDYLAEQVVPARLLHLVLADGVLALIAVGAMVLGPLLIPRVRAARMTASTTLLVVCLFAPGIPLLIFNVTGLGQVLWRLVWAVPIAALVGVLAARVRPPVVAVALCAAIVLAGTPVWSVTEPGIASKPAWKRWPASVEATHAILRFARPGDTILAPGPISETILVVSGEVTTVAPRAFYASALLDVPGGHGRERLLLYGFTKHGLGRVVGEAPWHEELPSRTIRAPDVRRALDAVGVDIVCMRRRFVGAVAMLREAGFRRVGGVPALTCVRAPG